MSHSRNFVPLTDDFFRPADRSSPVQEAPSPKHQAENTNLTMDILNRCFDDIEQFVNRLQRAAEAMKEITPGGKGPNSRPGSLNGTGRQYRPPPAKDFVIIFQKFKLAMNLLAKLNGHIQDPDAPELVHVILGPLQLVSEASRDSSTGSLELAYRVVSPLLSLEAVRLLSVCLSPQEMQLWESLGAAWNVPKDTWQGDVPTYVPIFSDGWSPPPSWLEESHREPAPTIHREPANKPPPPVPARTTSRRDVPTEDRNRETSPLSQPPPPLVLDDVPVILPPQSQEEIQHKFLLSLRESGSRPYTVLYDKVAENDKELTVKKGEIVEVIENTRSWWKVGNSRGEAGFVPSKILKPYTSSVSGSESWEDASEATDFFDKEILSVSGYDQYEYDLRPEQRQRTTVDDINDEFRLKCIGGKAAAPVKKPPVAPKPPAILLTEHSMPNEINAWLNSKGFSYRVQQQFATNNGRQLFQMTKKTIETICGNEEGTRLYSQILVQKNRSGYKTIRSQELLGILNTRRLRSDTEEINSSLDSEYY